MNFDRIGHCSRGCALMAIYHVVRCEEFVMLRTIDGIDAPGSAMAKAATALVGNTQSAVLFHHSSRVYWFGALIGRFRGIAFNPDSLYVGAMFHDMGLTPGYNRSEERFEIDGANAARTFLKSYVSSAEQVAEVWDAIVLHTSFGFAKHKGPVAELVAAGYETDIFGWHFDEVTAHQRDQVIKAHPRGEHFKQRMIDLLAEGLAHRPKTSFGNVSADVLERADPKYRRTNFCGLILGSGWTD